MNFIRVFCCAGRRKLACCKVGITEYRWHVLIHTYASHLVMMCGSTMKVMQELLGHASLEMTMRYTHLASSMKNRVVALLDERDTEVAQNKTPTLQSLETLGF